MKFCVQLNPQVSTDKAGASLLPTLLEQVRIAEAVGFDAFSMGDHYNIPGLQRLNQIPALARLYGPSLGEPGAGSDYPEWLKSESQRYVDYFHHPVPFPRNALADGFARCAGTEQSAACAELEPRVEAEVGPLDGAR